VKSYMSYSEYDKCHISFSIIFVIADGHSNFGKMFFNKTHLVTRYFAKDGPTSKRRKANCDDNGICGTLWIFSEETFATRKRPDIEFE